MAPEPPFIDDDRDDHTACWICPALRLPAGQFDVYDKPTRDCPFDPQTGYRYTADGTAVCVHPYKVGVPAGRYASQHEPFPQVVRHSPAVEPVRRPMPVATAPRPFPGPAPASCVSDAAIMAGERPDVPADLLTWMRGLVADAAPDDLESTLDQAEEAARARFPADSVVEALRRVLSGA